MEFGDVQDGILGVTGVPLDGETANKLEIDITEGYYITEIEEKSGAALAGLSEGDIIRKLDNVKINKFSDLSGYLRTKSPDDIVNVEVLRNDTIKTIPVTLTNKEDLYVEFMNMQLRDIPKRPKDEYPQLSDGGAIIIENKNKYFFTEVGLRRDFVITGINDIEIKSTDDLNKIKKKYGDDIFKNLNKLEFLDGNLKKREIIFR